MFNRLVPLEAHEASSLYSEEKARLLREVGDMVEEKDAELAIFLSSLKLEEIPNPGDHIALPPEVISFSDFFSSKSDLSIIKIFYFSYYNFRSLNALPAFRPRKMQLKN